jgi:hypothetical protein
MAKIVLGIGTSHSPQLSMPPELWPVHGETDQRNPDLADHDGKYRTYDELLAMADPSVQKELTPEKWAARHAACQKGIAAVAEALAAAKPDVVLICGDDQEEQFHDDNMPALLIYWGDTILNMPPRYAAPDAPPGVRAAAWAYGLETKTYPVASDLGRHMIETLIDQGFDTSHARRLKDGQGMGHAFAFVYGRLMNGNVVPTVPVMLNTYYPPNQPTPRRCYELGRAIRGAVESWDSDARVAIVGSGGLSHFWIDEDLDQRVLKLMQEKDADGLMNLPRGPLNAGTSEIRCWIVTAAAAESLDMRLIDYVPCYRTPAGTGCAMAFATWS